MDNIGQFFQDISYIFDQPSSKNSCSEKLNVQETHELQKTEHESLITKTQDSPLKKGKRTNVIYLNTDCNLRCEYCYEGDSRSGMPDKADLTCDKIDEFLQEIVDREKEYGNSTVVIMGGEPFLRFDLIKYTILKALTLQHSFGISLITNATLFTDKKIEELKYLINLSHKKDVCLTLEISYDGSGHDRRYFENKKSSKEIVEKNIKKILDAGIDIRISYTVHMGNYKNVIQDTIYILEKFKSKHLERISIGYAFTDLDKSGLGTSDNIAGEVIRKSLTPILRKVYEKYETPICAHTCGLCKQCEKGNFVGNSYLSPTTGVSYAEKKTEHQFKQF